jgi:hypothetical protein
MAEAVVGELSSHKGIAKLITGYVARFRISALTVQSELDRLRLETRVKTRWIA